MIDVNFIVQWSLLLLLNLPNLSIPLHYSASGSGQQASTSTESDRKACTRAFPAGAQASGKCCSVKGLGQSKTTYIKLQVSQSGPDFS